VVGIMGRIGRYSDMVKVIAAAEEEERSYP
jgi:hypothetical protein